MRAEEESNCTRWIGKNPHSWWMIGLRENVKHQWMKNPMSHCELDGNWTSGEIQLSSQFCNAGGCHFAPLVYGNTTIKAPSPILTSPSPLPILSLVSQTQFISFYLLFCSSPILFCHLHCKWCAGHQLISVFNLCSVKLWHHKKETFFSRVFHHKLVVVKYE